jgi:hypothetical protein
MYPFPPLFILHRNFQLENISKPLTEEKLISEGRPKSKYIEAHPIL